MEIQSTHGFRFTLAREEPYVRKDGEEVNLRVWSANCRVCNAAFEVKTPGHAQAYEDSKAFGARNCQQHRGSRWKQ